MLSAREIQNRLPHRYPCLLLDRVSELDTGRAVGYKNVSANEPHFRGHFPGNPVMPGVLTLEGLVQLAWLLYGREGRLVAVDRLKFRLQVKPGDRLDLEVVEVEADGDLRKLKATARVDGRTASEGLLTIRLEPWREASPQSDEEKLGVGG